VIDSGLEPRLQRWLAADAAAIHTPASLRARVLEIPAVSAPTHAWWHRFATVPAWSAGVAAAGVVAIVVTSLFFNLFDAPAGADGEPCNNRQIQRALDQLRDAEGYRYVNREQVRQLDPDAELSFDDPQYVWTDAWISEGAYLAPDRVRDVPTFTLPQLFNRGYLEHLQIGGATYQLREVDGTETWVAMENWPSANLVHQYVSNAFPAISIPGVTALQWRGTPVPDDMPGSGGCTAAAAIPFEQPPDGFGAIPSHMIEERIVAIRVDVASGRPTTVYLGPSVTGREGDGDSRNVFELTWTTPPAEEFVAPTDAVPDPGIGIGGSPPPTPSPLPVDPDAWAPVELSGVSGNLSSVVAGDRFVAVGADLSSGSPTGMIWNSADGITWEIVADGDEFEDLEFQSIAWNGDTFLAVGYRSHEDPDDPQLSSFRPETWVSTDGLTWEPGGEIGPGEATREVANPGTPVAAGPGWVAGGSIWSMEDSQQRPAFFTSPDGERWTTIELEDTGSGSLGRVVVLPDGRLFATGCESPSRTNSGQYGEACYMRPWHSEDGVTWTVGETLDVEIASVARWDDLLVAVDQERDLGGQNEGRTARVVTSTDGVTWTDLPGFESGTASVTGIRVVGDELVIDGQIVGIGSYPYGTAWRSGDGVEWEQISLGLPSGGTGSFIAGVIDTPTGLAFLGSAQLGETESIPVIWFEP
jgi:hypothetical protein